MPGIWNIGNAYNVNTKKVSSKLTFEVGERFTGRVIKKGDGKDITIKLADGWQFVANLEGNVNPDVLKLVKFQVDGFENGKLKLKLVQGTADEEITGDENFQEVIEKEGLSKDDIDILKNMVKHNIPLTRDNINQIKGLIQFNEKINANPKEIDTFIQTYLQSKGISSDSTEGKAVKEMLTKFFSEFKNMTSDDILAFVENNLDFSEETINSFNKLFKGDLSIEKILTKLNDSLNSFELSGKTVDNKVFENLINDKLLSKGTESSKNILDTATALASKTYNGNDSLTKKINILDVLKTLVGSEDSELNIIQKNLNGGSNDSSMGKTNLSSSLIEKLDNEEVVKLIKDTIGDDIVKSDAPKTQAEKLIESSNKSKVELLLSNIEGRQVKLTDDEFKEFSELLNNKIQGKDDKQENILPKEVSGNTTKDTVETKQSIDNFKIEDTILKTILGGKDEIRAEMKDEINNIRDIVKEIIVNTGLKEDEYDKIMNFIKSNISDIKALNSVKNEDYNLNTPIIAKLLEFSEKNIDSKVFESLINNELLNKGSDSSKNIMDTAKALASKTYNGNDPLTKKINILDVLKTLAGSEDSELNIIQKNLNSVSNDSNMEKTNISLSLIEKLDNEEIVKLIKDTIGDDLVKSDIHKTQAEKLMKSSNKSELEEVLSNIEGRQVKLTDDEFKTFSELLNNKIQGKDDKQENILPKEVSTNAMKDTVESKHIGDFKIEDTIFKTTLGGKDEIKAEMKDKINNIRDIVKEIIVKTEFKEDGHDKIMNLIKSNINDIKVFNSVSNEYYYLNVPINVNLQEYPCKLIIKDNRKDGKKIDTTNAKMIVSVKTSHLGEVDGYLTIKNNKIDVNLKCESEFLSTINNNKHKLAEGLSTLGLFVNIYVSIKDKPVDLVNCRSFFNDLTISSIDIKV